MQYANFYSLFDVSPVPMWVFDTDTLKFLEVNRAAVVNYGYSKDEFLDMTLRDIRLAEEVEQVEKFVSQNAETGSYFRKIFRHRRKNGEEISVEVQSNLINYKDHKARIVLATDITDKLKAERNLLKSEERFKALVQDGSDLITILDSDFHYQYVSPASVKVFGVEPSFFIGRDPFQYIHPDDKERVVVEAKQIWSKRKIQLSPYRYKDSCGNWIWIETCATNLLNDPAVEGIVCTSKDITERIAADMIIRENIERYNIVSKATSDVIWDCDFKQNRITWNKALKGILKYSGKNQTTFDWWKEHIHPEDQEKVLEKFQRHLDEGKEKWSDEYRFLCGDGKYRYIFDRGFLLVDENNAPSRMIGAMQDISKRKEEEQWSKLLESVVINTSDGVLITDASPYPGPYIVYVNDAMLKMSGYAEKELIGKSPAILHGEANDQCELDVLKEAIEKGMECTLELKNYTKNGRPYDVSITICPVTDSKKQLTNWISIQRDVTKQKEYLNAIEEQNARLRNIRWLQSHGVRAPLARIMSLVELLGMSQSKEETAELIDYLQISAAELDQIVTAIANETPKG
ncbi:MAG: PAS domain S-box protein [Pedobacter sp.]|nr:PAS domain S-box protein [Pedobacter sp.]MDQ8054041.1 PAS domain S-box protein [Pedobacter sp.]